MTIFRRSVKSLPSSGVVGGGNPATFCQTTLGPRLRGDDVVRNRSTHSLIVSR